MGKIINKNTLVFKKIECGSRTNLQISTFYFCFQSYTPSKNKLKNFINPSAKISRKLFQFQHLLAKKLIRIKSYTPLFFIIGTTHNSIDKYTPLIYTWC